MNLIAHILLQLIALGAIVLIMAIIASAPQLMLWLAMLGILTMIPNNYECKK